MLRLNCLTFYFTMSLLIWIFLFYLKEKGIHATRKMWPVICCFGDKFIHWVSYWTCLKFHSFQIFLKWCHLLLKLFFKLMCTLDTIKGVGLNGLLRNLLIIICIHEIMQNKPSNISITSERSLRHHLLFEDHWTIYLKRVNFMAYELHCQKTKGICSTVTCSLTWRNNNAGIIFSHHMK